MAGSVIAKAWVHIIPEMSGIQGEVTKEMTGVAKTTEKAGRASGGKFSTGFKAAVGSLGAMIAGIGISSLVQGAAESASVMSRLSASAQQNSVSAESMSSAYNGLVGVLGESDRAVETAGNMFAMCGDNQAELQTLTTALTGAFSQFGDGLPIESLAEAANETARTGVVVGGMADALNWVNASSEQWSAALSGNAAAQQAFNAAVGQGMSKEDAFNQALAACSTEGERNQLVIDTLNALYGEAGRNYQQANADLIAYNQSQSELDAGMQALGQSLMPAMSGLKSLAGTALQAVAPAFGEVSRSAGQLASDVGAAIEGTVADVSSGAGIGEAIRSNFGEIFIGLKENAVSGITSVCKELPVLLPMVTEAGVSLFMGLVRSLPEVIPPLIEGVGSVIEQAANYLPQLVPLVLQAAFVLFMAIVQALPGIVASLLSSLAQMIVSAGSTIAGGAGQLLSSAQQMFAGLISGAAKGVIDFMYEVSLIPGKVAGVFADAGSWLYNAGKSLLEGLGRGVKGAIDGVVGTVEDVVGTIRSFFPFSPAKRGPFSGHGYTTYSGKALIEDWGKAMGEEAPTAVDYAKRAVAAVQGSIGTARFRVSSRSLESDGARGGVSQTFNVYANDPSLVAAVVAKRQYESVRRAVS